MWFIDILGKECYICVKVRLNFIGDLVIIREPSPDCTNISQEDIYISMQRSVRFRKTVSKIFSSALDVFETILS